MMSFREIVAETRAYNFHTHTEFCDGKAPMCEMAAAAWKQGMSHIGFSPHSPVSWQSGCNMRKGNVAGFLSEIERLKERYAGEMAVYAGMEIDYLDDDWGAHIDYFQKLPLDYRIGSIHFIRSQEGEIVDVDGTPASFLVKLKEKFRGDLRYVVENFFVQELKMIERGGFDIIGHCDKIARNAAAADPAIEEQGWYVALMRDVINRSIDAVPAVEINTKIADEENRFFPHTDWWRALMANDTVLLVNSDAHRPDCIISGREKAYSIIDSLCKTT